MSTLNIAIEGCCHGQLDSIYASLAEAESETGSKVDLLLVCGDFQALRNRADLKCLAVPDKYAQLGCFHKYYSGEAKAPVLTVVIGGNHEASNYMWELYHGGWIAPNIYYLGCAGSVIFNGLRISGASGIYNGRDYHQGHHEKMPFDRSTMRSIYHIRQYDVFRLAQLERSRPDIFLSHDWPLNIDKYGDTAGLIRYKPFFREEINRNALGSPPLMDLLKLLKPPFWFAAHLHAKFAALVKHDGSQTRVKQRMSQTQTKVEQAENPDAIDIDLDDEDDQLPKVVEEKNPDAIEIDLDDGDEDVANPDSIEIALEENGVEAEAVDAALQPDAGVDESIDLAQAKAALLASLDKIPDQPPISIDQSREESSTTKKERYQPQIPRIETSSEVTKFLALSKCGHQKQFLQIIQIAAPRPKDAVVQLEFDPLWLAITRACHPFLSLEYKQTPLPTNREASRALVDTELAWIETNLSSGGRVAVDSIQQFSKTAPSTLDHGGDLDGFPLVYTNPQTEALMKFLHLENKVNPGVEQGASADASI